MLRLFTSSYLGGYMSSVQKMMLRGISLCPSLEFKSCPWRHQCCCPLVFTESHTLSVLCKMNVPSTRGKTSISISCYLAHHEISSQKWSNPFSAPRPPSAGGPSWFLLACSAEEFGSDPDQAFAVPAEGPWGAGSAVPRLEERFSNVGLRLWKWWHSGFGPVIGLTHHGQVPPVSLVVPVHPRHPGHPIAAHTPISDPGVPGAIPRVP